MIGFLGAPFTELIIFVLLVAYAVIRRHEKQGISLLKVAILLIVFIYFAWMPIVWPSLIPSSMLTLSVFGMFVVNFYFLYSLIQARIEQPYRQALTNLVREPEKHEIFRDIWSSGKRFYYYSYFFQSLVSGVNPFHFLSDIANDRVRDDIKDALRQLGVEKKLISLSLMVGFMKSRLATDANLPADFKEVMGKTLDDLLTHPWLEEQINEFLRLATESPEDLHFPEWMAYFENSVTGKK
jgi:energy-coupling factor transporter transmembrane protein EcfT